MRKPAILLALILSSPAGLRAAEKPAPAAGSDKEIHAALNKHLQEQMKANDGAYPLYDEETDETYSLELAKIGTIPTMRAPGGRAIVRVSFKQRGDPEFGEKDRLFEADFTLIRGAKGWEIKDETVYSVNGTARFKYGEDFRRVRLESAEPEEEPGPGLPKTFEEMDKPEPGDADEVRDL